MQIPEVPGELKEWSENVAAGTFFGMLYCGGRQFLANRKEGLAQLGFSVSSYAARPPCAPKGLRIL